MPVSYEAAGRCRAMWWRCTQCLYGLNDLDINKDYTTASFFISIHIDLPFIRDVYGERPSSLCYVWEWHYKVEGLFIRYFDVYLIMFTHFLYRYTPVFGLCNFNEQLS